MANNDFLVFNSNKQNMIDQSVYQESNYRINGVTPGIAPSAMHNRMFYQWSMMCAAFGQFVASQGFDALDADQAQLTNNITQALLAIAGNNVLFWQPNKTYAVGDIVYSKVIGLSKWLYCTQGGISSATEPTWAANGETTADNTVRWLTYAGGSSLASEGVPPAGVALPFRGSFGGTGNKHPIDRITGKVNTAWHICDGTNGTMDMRGKFILASSPAYPAGSTGGSANVTLTEANIPPHRHLLFKSGHGLLGISSGNYPTTNGRPEWGSWSYQIQGSNSEPDVGLSGLGGNEGSGKSLDIMPPYYSLAYIEQIS